MKNALLIFILFQFGFIIANAQEDTTRVVDKKEYLIIKNDGTRFQGKIISRDAREILFDSKKLGQIYIPMHDIKEIKELTEKDMRYGDPTEGDNFSTRYFLTTNGLPILKGENYIQWNLFGPDFQFGVADNFGIGIMTTWFGSPIIGSAKYTINLSEDVNLGLGTLIGTGSWLAPDYGVALPYAAITFGNRSHNINFSGGYGAVWVDGDNNGRALASIAGLVAINDKISLVFDSFIMLPGGYRNVVEYHYDPNTGNYGPVNVAKKNLGFAALIPGIRFHTDYNKAFQFGFAGVINEGELMSLPIPMIQWYRKL